MAKFFDFVGLQGTIEERAKVLAEKGKDISKPALDNSIRFAQSQKERVEKEEISPATLMNYFKAIKLFWEMNDIAIAWKKITRGLPRARRFADDRAPILDEIRKLTG